MPKLFVALLFTIFSMLPSIACAADAKLGLELAEKNCGMCHAIRATGESANPRSPPFREIAKKYPPEDLEEALAEGVMVSHDAPMPEFTLSPKQIDDLIAYLKDLNK